MEVKEKYQEICQVFQQMQNHLGGKIIRIPQAYQAIYQLEDQMFTIVCYTNTDYQPYIEEIMLTTSIAIRDTWRLKKNPNLQDIEVHYTKEDSKELIRQLLKNDAFQAIMKQMGHHSLYVQDGQLFMHINPSHDITEAFFTLKYNLLVEAKQIIQQYL